LRTVGIDVNEDVIASINAGVMPFHYPAMTQWLQSSVTSGNLKATGNSKTALESADVIVVTVGTPFTEHFGLDYKQLYPVLHELTRIDLSNKSIIMRSTSSPGTFKRVILPFLQKETQLVAGQDYAVAVCPERILEGKAHEELYTLPEIVGVNDDISFQIAQAIFHRINPKKKVLRTTPTGAELAKIFTNVYRYVNFALSNEFAIWAEKYGEDANTLIAICNEDYLRAQIPRPGFAGGPCLSKDSMMLDSNTTFTSIVSAAWKLNENIPHHVLSYLLEVFGSIYGLKISVLGSAFKADSDDVRLSPSAKLIEILKTYGAQVTVHDPFVSGTASLAESLSAPDIVILATKHSAFRGLPSAIDNSGCTLIYDVWGFFEPTQFKRTKYKRFGSP
jgi:UDP-N-acetyl-D-mannosaminuronic acid dehydrogenase